MVAVAMACLSPVKMSTFARRARGIALACIASLALLEALLQAGALVVWLWHRPAAQPAATADSVLCVGDSYTWGVGATDPSRSYPGQLQEMLSRHAGRPWRVHNKGWPGQNSREVLTRLAADLAGTRARVVCVGVGINDTWSHPELTTLASDAAATDPDRFRWEYRSLRLLKLFGGLFGSPGAAARSLELAAGQGTPVGCWRVGSVTLHFRESGDLDLAAASLKWSVTGDQLEVSTPVGLLFKCQWRVAEGRLQLGPEGVGWSLLLDAAEAPGEESSEVLAQRGWWALGQKDAVTAESMFRQVIARGTDDAWVHQGRVSALAMLGRSPEAEQELQWIEERCARQADADPAAAEARVQALSAIGRHPEACRLGEALLQSRPDAFRTLAHLANYYSSGGDYARAMPKIERALALLPKEYSGWRAHLLRLQSRAIRAQEPRRAVELLVESWLIDRSKDDVYAAVNWMLPEVNQWLEPVLASSQCAEADKHALRQLFARQEVKAEVVLAPLLIHLGQMAALCASHGAQMILIDYPFGCPDVAEVHRRAARELGLPYVPVWPHFQQLLKQHRLADLYNVPDGHCNDEGYRQMALLVFEHLRQRL
jgi:lysophospholipase L1-like esterase